MNPSMLIRLEGTATYRERMMLPEGAVLQVTVEDVSRADTSSTVLGQAEVRGHTAPPIPFVVEYPADRLQAGHRYGVRARITHEGELLFVTDTFNPLPSAAITTPLELLLVRAQSPSRR